MTKRIEGELGSMPLHDRASIEQGAAQFKGE